MAEPDKPHDVFGRYNDENMFKQLPWCRAGVVIQGQWYPCDLVPPHDGWAHGNREVEAMWHCDNPRVDPPRHPSWEWKPEPHLKGEE